MSLKTSPSRPFRWHEPLAAIGCYLAITVAFFGPILGRLNHQIVTRPGAPPADHLQVLWNAWWIKSSLFQGGNPYFCDMLFFPYGTPLVLHSLTPIQTSAIALMSSALTTELAYNIAIIAGFPIAGIGAYALCRYVTHHHLASLVGGIPFMLSPFIASKAADGWVNMLYAGVLPLYLECLLYSTERAPKRPQLSRVLLATTVLLVLFGDPVLAVFAANLTACAFVWQSWSTRNPRDTAVRFARALGPAALIAGPYLIMMAYYMFKYGFTVDVGRRLNFIPEALSYVLPFNGVSPYARLLTGLNLTETARTDLARTDTACYLGILVLPLSLAGLVAARRNSTVQFMALLFVLFLALSMGPKLLFLREIVYLGPFQVRLPFGLWQKIPVLGAVAQSGRYLVISYMAMSVGLACLVVALRNRFAERWGSALTGVMALAVCVDFAFVLGASPLPPVPLLSGNGGVVLDPRLRSGATMYYQMDHQRPLVGGYLSRRPEYALRRYRQMPGFDCLFFGNPSGDCDRALVLSSLRSLGVTDILLDPGDWRGDLLERYGFRKYYADAWTAVWAVPHAAP